MENVDMPTRGERILVALDGSVPSNYALEKAVSLVKKCPKCQGKIFLIRVLEMSAQEGVDDEGQNRLVEDMKMHMGQIEQDIKKQGLECESLVHVGPEIAPWIVKEAQEKDVDLIAMGTHGWTGQTAIVAMGSVARKVLCTSSCPVLIIPPKMSEEKQAECTRS
ncbi:MAG: universal stress protein [Desulfovermiculus sp.]|nr:universal stress protein [Desulfovermiculus sp.]